MSCEEITIRKAQFTGHQIIAVLKSVEAGRTVKDVCREAGISEASYFYGIGIIVKLNNPLPLQIKYYFMTTAY